MDPKSQNLNAPDGTLPTAFEKPRRERSGAIGELRSGAQVGKYRVVRHLGAGGMGTVYEAVQVEIGKAVALKLLTGALAQDPRAHARFLQEAANLSRLEHPHIVGVFDFGADAESPYLVMELLRGEDLADHICRHLHGLPIDKAVDILLPVCTGIMAAHEAGIIHRDIKPRNIFLAANSLKEVVPKVLDFGIAKVDGEGSETSLTQRGAVVGTPQYIAPEQIKGASADSRTDQYALGVVLYECLVGRNAFEGHTPYEIMKNVESGKFFPPSRFRPDLPPELEQITLRAMSNDPKTRFPSILDLGRALLPFASTRQRAMWSDYFLGPEVSGRTAGSTTAPLPPRITVPGSTRLLAAPPPEIADSSLFVNSSTAHSTIYRTTAPRRGWIVAVIMVGVAAAFVAAQFAKSSKTAADQAPRDKAQLTAEPQAQPGKEVTITLIGAAPETVALVDGWPQHPPFKLTRGNVAREIPVQAPGYQTETYTIVPSEDQSLKVNLRPVAPPEPAKPLEVTFNISSTPEGADVFIDGESQSFGKTPRALAVEKGTEPREITLQLAGFKPRRVILLPDMDRAPVVQLERLPMPARGRRGASQDEGRASVVKLPD